jgi:molybdate transport system permease protein
LATFTAGRAQAFANSAEGVTGEYSVEISTEGDAAQIDGVDFAIDSFERLQSGSNRPVNDVYYGYTYFTNGDDSVIAINAKTFAVCYVDPDILDQFGLSLDSDDDKALIKAYIGAMDADQSMGSGKIEQVENWYFTTESEIAVEGAVFSFNQELSEGRFYTCVIGEDGQDITDTLQLVNLDSAKFVLSDQATIVSAGGPMKQLATLLASIDYSPLFVTLKTCGVAIIFVFVLGLAAAYFTLRVSKRWQDILDTIFTIPMVLPPTVCGFLLLILLGKNTALGRFFQDIGFPLVFSWQATVIAATVVAFPLMYRSARGAFENLDPNMMDAARTLGWSNARIFFKLMLPLAWSSIAAGTVLAFARALGEFGCTLFLAGNQIGVTRTIPIAIYFEWMNGNMQATWFWTITLIVFSFVVILFINLWSRHTTKYRQARANDAPRRRRGRKAQVASANAVEE